MASAILPSNDGEITYNSVQSVNSNLITSTQINADGTIAGSDGYTAVLDLDNPGVADY